MTLNEPHYELRKKVKLEEVKHSGLCVPLTALLWSARSQRLRVHQGANEAQRTRAEERNESAEDEHEGKQRKRGPLTPMKYRLNITRRDFRLRSSSVEKPESKP